jgi:hypothetical protein
MLPTATSAARAATRTVATTPAVAARPRAAKTSQPPTRSKALHTKEPGPRTLPTAITTTTHASRQKVVTAAAPKSVASGLKSGSHLTNKDRQRLQLLAPAIEADLAQARESHFREIRHACEYHVLHGDFSFDSEDPEVLQIKSIELLQED